MSVLYEKQYRPGALTTICAMQTQYYARDWGFDHRYEAIVSSGVGEFLLRYNPYRDLILLVLRENEVAGGIVIDGGGDEEGKLARLRWFIVSEELRGSGVGFSLIERAMVFVREQNYETVFLTTFEGLDPARRLYEKAGFRLVEENEKSTWGKTVKEQRFEFVATLIQSA